MRPGFDRPDLTEKIAATFQWALTTPDLADVRRHQQAMNALRASRPDLSRMSDRELVEQSLHLIDTHFRGLFAEHVFVSLLATMPVGIITKVCQAVGRPDDVLRLLAGVGDVESAAPAMEMWALGRRAASSPALWAAFDAGADGLEHRLRASADPDLTGFASLRRVPGEPRQPRAQRVGAPLADVGDASRAGAGGDRPDEGCRRKQTRCRCTTTSGRWSARRSAPRSPA